MTPAGLELLRRLANGNSYPRRDLAADLSLSMPELDAALAELKQYGLDTGVSKEQCQLGHAVDFLQPARIQSHLAPHWIEQLAIDYRPVIDSTNMELLRHTRDRQSGSVCLADFQTAGRGRRGRQWHAPFGGSICCSMLWRFERGADLRGLSLAIGIVVAESLARQRFSVQLKWPNDLLVDGRKLGGILVQLKPLGLEQVAVVGVGINCRLPTEAEAVAAIDQPWIDLAELAFNEPIDRNLVVATLIEHLAAALASFAAQGLRPFLSRWVTLDCLMDQPVKVAGDDKVVFGVARGVDEVGQLLLETEPGKRRALSAGEVSVRTL